jgi:hypothetical protein
MNEAEEQQLVETGKHQPAWGRMVTAHGAEASLKNLIRTVQVFAPEEKKVQLQQKDDDTLELKLHKETSELRAYRKLMQPTSKVEFASRPPAEKAAREMVVEHGFKPAANNWNIKGAFDWSADPSYEFGKRYADASLPVLKVQRQISVPAVRVAGRTTAAVLKRIGNDIALPLYSSVLKRIGSAHAGRAHLQYDVAADSKYLIFKVRHRRERMGRGYRMA